MEDDAVVVLGVRGRARYAQAHVPKRRRHHHVPRVLQCWLLRHEELLELFGFLGSAVDFFEEGHHRGARAQQADITSDGVQIVIFPASLKLSSLRTTLWLCSSPFLNGDVSSEPAVLNYYFSS